MFWRSKKQERIQITEVVQDENDVFDIAIIALERLEALLLAQRGYNDSLMSTAMGSERDLHQKQRSIHATFKELLLQCQALNNCSAYDEKEIFNIAAELFMGNLMEWYAGRKNLEFFDEVDSAVIPLLFSLIDSDPQKITEIFNDCVYDTTVKEEESLDEKHTKVKRGFDAWIKAQEYFAELQAKKIELNQKAVIISHKRGEAVDGYIRIIKALTSTQAKSAPVKLVYRLVAQYLPDLIESVPHLNEEFIERYYEKESQNLLVEKKDNNDNDKFEKDGVTYLRLHCQNPIDILKEKVHCPYILWKHGDDDCNGDIYLGDNAMLYCKKCNQYKSLLHVSFEENDKIRFNTENIITHSDKDLIKALAISHMGDLGGFNWLEKVIFAIREYSKKIESDKEQILPILQDAVKRILDESNIEYNEIIIDIK